MPLLYLAKVNLNSRIFDVYNDVLEIDDVSSLIYQTIKDGISYSRLEKKNYTDTHGNIVHYSSDSKYTFREISKKDNVITGKLVRTFDKPTEKLDEYKNKMITTYITESVSISFYYDVFKELLTFCERQSFGYNQFTRTFAQMLNICTCKYEFEIFLQKDRNLLDEKLKTLKVVQKLKARLIPPNSNADDIQTIRSETDYMRQCEDTNSRKISIEYTSDNMNMEAKVMKDIMNAVSQGYGDITAIGINNNNRTASINSSQEAAFTNNIKDNIDKKGFIDESKNLIERFLLYHATKSYRRN